MENIVEKSKKLVTSQSNIARTIVKLANQLEELNSFNHRKYIQETYPELEGSAYIQKVAELRDESDLVTSRLESLLNNLNNQYLNILRYAIEDWFAKQNKNPYKVKYFWTVQEVLRVIDRQLILHRLHVMLECKFYSVHLSIGIPVNSKEIEIVVFIRPKHKSADIDAQIAEMCEGQRVMPSGSKMYKNLSFPIEKGQRSFCSTIKSVMNELPKIKNKK